MPDIDSSLTSGVEVGGYRRGATTADPWHQYVVPVLDHVVSYTGRTATFRIPGRAGTTGQKLMTLHNGTGSTVFVDVEGISVDLAVTVIKAITVLPPLIRVSRITALPTGGTALTKGSTDTALTPSASVTLLQDASAEGTSSASPLTATALAGPMTQEFAPRFITGAGYEPADRLDFLSSGSITLRALEGIVVELIYTAAGQNPITDMWSVTAKWHEYTRP